MMEESLLWRLHHFRLHPSVPTLTYYQEAHTTKHPQPRARGSLGSPRSQRQPVCIAGVNSHIYNPYFIRLIIRIMNIFRVVAKSLFVAFIINYQNNLRSGRSNGVSVLVAWNVLRGSLISWCLSKSPLCKFKVHLEIASRFTSRN